MGTLPFGSWVYELREDMDAALKKIKKNTMRWAARRDQAACLSSAKTIASKRGNYMDGRGAANLRLKEPGFFFSISPSLYMTALS